MDSGAFTNFESRVRLYGFQSVTNCRDLVTLTSDQSRVAIVDLSMVCSEFHIKTAVCKALTNEETGCMKTKSISAEVLYQLSPTTKINESIKQYGASESSSLIAVVIIDNDPVGDNILAKVEGKPLELALLSGSEFCTGEKTESIIKFFRLSHLEVQVSTLEAAVITHLAIKDCL